MLILAATDIAPSVSFLAEGSEDDERVWALVHTFHGPYLLCSWYRPPGQGEDAEFTHFEAELHEFGQGVMGTIITGDTINLGWCTPLTRHLLGGNLLQ